MNLGDLFGGGCGQTYALQTMTCFCRGHYMAFVSDGAGSWRLYDDTKVSAVGNWAAVKERCRAALLRPTLLLYAAP